VTVLWDMDVFAWTLPATPAPAAPVALDAQGVDSAAFDPKGARVITMGGRQAPLVWDVASGQRVGRLAGHRGQVLSAAFGGGGALLATGSDDKTAIVWDAEGMAPLYAPLAHGSAVKLVALAPGGRLVTATREGVVRAWEARSGKPLTAGVRPNGGETVVAISPDGRRVLAVTSDGRTAAEVRVSTARVFDADTGEPVSRPMTHGGLIHQAIFSHDGTLVATASNDHTARVWDAATGEPRSAEPMRHEGPVFAVAFSGDDGRVVTGSHDHTARVWDAKTARPLTPPMVHDGPSIVRRVAFSPDGNFVATGTDYYVSKVWDARSGQAVTTALGWGAKSVEELEFAPDSRRLLTLFEDHKLRVWNVGADARPVEDLLKFAEVLSGRVLDETGGETPLSPGQFAALGRQLAAAYPGEFLPPLTSELAAAALANKDVDGRVLAALGERYAADRQSGWAAKLIEAARERGGQKVEPTGPREGH
jgi:WD40 repeat protein